MHAIRLHAFGPPENLVLDELPDLEPGAGEVRIAVEASGVHLLDTTIRRGEPGPLPPPELPTVPGREVAGVVDARGPGHRPRPGWGSGSWRTSDRCPVGTPSRRSPRWTSSSRCPTTSRSRTPWPPSAPGGPRWASSSSSLPARTTWSWCRRPPVGWAGCWCSRRWRPVRRWSRPLAASARRRSRSLGAHLVVDYGEPGWDEKVRAETGGVSLVYDGVGGEVGRQSLELLRPGGRLVMFGYSAGTPTQLTTDDLLGRGISAGWSLGARMVALPGGIPGLAGRALERWPPASGGRSSRRTRCPRRPGRTPTWRAAGRSGRSCC